MGDKIEQQHQQTGEQETSNSAPVKSSHPIPAHRRIESAYIQCYVAGPLIAGIGGAIGFASPYYNWSIALIVLGIVIVAVGFVLHRRVTYGLELLNVIELPKVPLPIVSDGQIEPPFAVKLGMVLEAESRDFNSLLWWKWLFPPVPETVSPVHRAMNIRITNRQAIKSQIKSVKVEAMTASQSWVPLNWLDFDSGGTIYAMGYDPRKAFPVQFLTLNLMLNEVLEPDRTIEGWAFFEIPCDLPKKTDVRITLEDYRGAKFTQIPERMSSDEFNRSPFMEKREGPNVDLTRCPKSFYSEVQAAKHGQHK